MKEKKNRKQMRERERERLAQLVKPTQWLMWIIEKSIKLGYAFEKVKK